MSETTEAAGTARRPFWRRREYWLAGFALAVLGGAAVAVPGVMAFRGLGAGGAHGFGRGFAHDPEKAREHAAFAIEWAFRAVDGTEEQKQQARLVVDRAIDQLAPVASRHRDHREAITRELAKPQIDRAALEDLREKEMALADEASRVAVAAVADLAEVLSPAQRAELVGLVHRFHRHGSPPAD